MSFNIYIKVVTTYVKLLKLKGTHNKELYGLIMAEVERTMVNIPNWKELTTAYEIRSWNEFSLTEGID